MNNIGKSIARRQEALEKFKTKRKEFLIAKEQINREIEEARTIWRNALKQLPEQPFSQ